MADQNIQVNYDADSAIAAVNKLRDVLQSQITALDQFAVKAAKFDDAGKLMTATVIQYNSEGAKLTRTFRENQGALEQTIVTVERSTKAYNDALKSQQLHRAALQATQIIAQKAALPENISTSNVSTATLERYQRAQQAFVKALAETKVSAQEVDRIINDIASGGLPKLEVEGANVQRTFLRLLDATRQLKDSAAGKATGPVPIDPKVTAFLGVAQRTFPAPTTNNLAALAAYQAAMQRLQATVAGGNVNLDQLSQVMQQLQQSPQQAAAGFNTLPPAMQKAQQALTQLAATSQNLGGGGGGGGLFGGLINQFQLFVRLVETQFAHRIIGAFITAVQQGFTEAYKLQQRISEIRSIAQGSGQSFEYVALSVRSLSDEFGKTQADVAEAAYQALSNQVAKNGDAFGFLSEALRFSRLSLSSAKDSVNLLSSAINSFGLTTDHARYVGDQFFTLIKEGRVRAEDLAGAYGRVGPAAASLGLSIAETNAAIAAISVKGVLPAEALTQLSAVINALNKPSKQMKDLFEQWGVASGQAAVATFGFGGVIEKLTAELQKGPEILGGEITNLRALRGAFALAGDGGSQFNRILNETGNASKNASEGLKIIGESAGDQLQKKIQRLKNFFEADLGDTLVKVVNKLLTGVESLTGSLDKASSGFAGIVAGTLAAITATKVVTTVWAAGKLALDGLRVSATGAATSIGFLNAAMLGAGIGIAIAVSNALEYNAAMDEVAHGQERLRAKLDSENKKIINDAVASETAQLEAFKQRQKEQIQGALLLSAEQRKALTELKKDVEEVNKALTDRLKVGFDDYIRSIRERINDLSRDATRAQSAIEKSQKYVEGFQEKAQQKFFEQAVGFESDPTTKLQLVVSRLRQLRQQMLEEYNKANQLSQQSAQAALQGDRESADRLRAQSDAALEGAKRRSGEIERLLGQRTQIAVEARKRAVAAGATQFLITDQDPITGAYRQRIQVGDILNREQQDYLRINKEIAQQEKANQQIRDQERVSAKAAAEQERHRADEIQRLSKQLISFTPYEKSGAIKKEFQVPGLPNELDTKKAQAAIEKIKDQLITIGGKDLEAQVALSKTIGEKIAAVRISTDIEITLKHQNELDKQLKATQENGQKILAELQKQRADQLKEYTDALTNLNAGASKAVEQVRAVLASIGYGRTRSEISTLADTINEAYSRIERGSKALAQPQFLKAEDVKKTEDEIRTSIAVINDAFQRVQKLLAAGNLSSEKLDELHRKFLETPETTTARGKQLGESLDQAIKARAARQATAEQISQVKDQIDLVNAAWAEKFPGAMKMAQDKMNEASQSMQSQIDEKLIKPTGRLIDVFGTDVPNAIEKMKSALDKLPRTLIPLPAVAPGPAPIMPPAFADGGPILGRGAVPIIAHEGEFVINAESTRRFYTQLVAMNAGFAPKAYEKGGIVTVGDININLTASERPESTVRDFGRALYREIRRGTIKGLGG